MDSEICLFGASGHAKVLFDIALSSNKEIIAFFDDKPIAKKLISIQIYHSDEISKFIKKKFVIAIGNNLIREVISKKIKVDFDILIHKTAIISSSSIIKKGTVVMQNSIINFDVKIGSHVIINTGAIIEHDCIVEDFAHISPGVILTGNVFIGKGSHIGAGAVVIPGIKIGKWVTVGAGAVITKNLPDYSVVVGNPGKIIKYKE